MVPGNSIFGTIRKIVAGLFVVLLFSSPLHSQTRIYFSAGSNYYTQFFIEGFYRTGVGPRVFITDGSYKNNGFGEYLSAELSIDAPLYSLIHGVTGITIFQTGYQNSVDIFLSEFKATYLGIPLLLRANFANAALLDFGVMARVPLSAELDETGWQGTPFEQRETGDISSYLTQLSLDANIRLSVLINRYTLTWYFIAGKGQVDRSFQDEWPLQGGSIFLRDLQPRYEFWLTGIQAGFRIK